MSQKVHPKLFRIGITESWDSRWFDLKKYKEKIEDDFKIRKLIDKKFEKGVVEKVIIERLADKIRIIIRSPKPGLLIGKGGKEIEALTKKISILVSVKQIKIDIEDIKDPSLSASILSQQIASDFERRVPYRKAVKRLMKRVVEKKKVEGIRIIVKGRLNGSEIARKETFKQGKLPLQTLRADIDYGEALAMCSYGIIGIKVWLYKGEKI